MFKNNLAIIGTVGIPANYGGFETLAEQLALRLQHQISITVYCSARSYPSRSDQLEQIKLKYMPFKANGVQSIIYDICALFAAARQHQLILILGVSGCIVLPLFRIFYPSRRLIINIDGLEHRRAKWHPLIRRFLRLSEKMAIRYGDEIVADNPAIRSYISDTYGKKSAYIPYGSDHVVKADKSLIIPYILPSKYALKVCRIEPENNIEMVLEAFEKMQFPLVLIGNWNNSNYGKKLRSTFSKYPHIQLLDPIYDQQILDQIRSKCYVYIHGHSAGGTNPSLVEAMSLRLPIFAFDCAYNRETTHGNAKYFDSADQLCTLLYNVSEKELLDTANKMYDIASMHYTWAEVTAAYASLMQLPLKESFGSS